VSGGCEPAGPLLGGIAAAVAVLGCVVTEARDIYIYIYKEIYIKKKYIYIYIKRKRNRKRKRTSDLRG
jgi:hypothetical protein